MQDNTTGTKSKIVDSALRLFAAEGYDKVTMRDIAKSVGILSGSIYGHFKSKESILEACYSFYLEHKHDNRLKKEEYLPILKNGTKEDIVRAINYSFPNDILEKMISALLIMYSRMYIDDTAMDMYADEINSSLNYMDEFFNAGIEIGRFKKFNVRTVSLIYLSSRLFAAHSVTLKPEQKDQWREAELDMFNELIKIIPFTR